jgi:hypothetical protein
VLSFWAAIYSRIKLCYETVWKANLRYKLRDLRHVISEMSKVNNRSFKSLYLPNIFTNCKTKIGQLVFWHHKIKFKIKAI